LDPDDDDDGELGMGGRMGQWVDEEGDDEKAWCVYLG